MTRCDLSLGFVGLGALGLPMAINLHRAEFPLRVHTRSRSAETSPELEGALRCSSPADTSTGVDVPLERVRGILEVIGGSIHHFGGVGRGQQVKAVNQVLVAGSYAAVAEAVALGQQLDLPMPQVIDALKTGAAGSWALEHRSTAMLHGSYPLGFRLNLHRKDLGIALDAAKAVQLDLPVTTLVEQLELDLINNGHGDEDVAALHRWNQTRQES